MIIIFSTKTDKSTTNVQRWLDYFEEPYIMVYPGTEFQLRQLKFELDKTTLEFTLNGVGVNYSELKCMWYRRGGVPIHFSGDMSMPAVQYTQNEVVAFRDFIIHFFNKIPGINKIGAGNINKLKVLSEALELGISVPCTTVSTRKSAVLDSHNEKIITKGIYGESFRIGDYRYFHGTKVVDFTELPESYNYSLIQDYQEKQYELRVFYLLGDFFTMSIYSQDYELTKIDWRRGHSISNKVRKCPYNLPKKLEKKLKNLMNKLNLNSGSIDLIREKNGDYVLLEINPVGQYDTLNRYCNFNLDKVIAKELIKIKNNEC